MIVLVLAILLGGAGTFALLSAHGLLLAALAAPIGGSLAGLLAALVLGMLRRRTETSNDTSVRRTTELPSF
ncbi:hypothetical protein [Methylobacterium sp. A54F]